MDNDEKKRNKKFPPVQCQNVPGLTDRNGQAGTAINGANSKVTVVDD